MADFDESPGKTLSIADAVFIIIGVVIGAGIFRTPSLVAANSGSVIQALSFWLAGGVVTLIGALCYAELTSAYPHSGGEYHYINRAFGSMPGFLFAWARITVIQTGSIAMLAFMIGDYSSGIFSLGPYSSAQYAAFIIVFLTAVNAIGILPGKRAQRGLIAALGLGLFFVVAVGMVYGFSTPPEGKLMVPSATGFSSLGQAMIFVLLTFGGWNEAAYLSAEVRNAPRNMSRVLLASIVTITLIYLAVNYVMLQSLGLQGVAGSQAVAADLMRLSYGENGARFVSFLIIVAAVSTMNATMMTGARSSFALGQDFFHLRFLGRWNQGRGTPVNALLVQGLMALSLVVLGSGSRNGFETMIEYTAPVFWFFVLLIGVSIFVLRHKDPQISRPFRVPLYPLMPLFFCSVCVYMLISSFLYTGKGALFGVAVLGAGVPLLWVIKAASGSSPSERRKRVMKRILSSLILLSLAGLVFIWLMGGQTKIIKPDVPYVPTPMEVVDEMLQMAGVNERDVLYDLGSGDGRIVITAAQRWATRGVGIEIDPRLVQMSRRKASWANVADRVEFVENDLFKSDIGAATVVTLYLLPELNIRLRPKLLSDLRPGTRVVSHSFDMKDWVPDETRLSAAYWELFVDYDHSKRSFVYLWIIPANINGTWRWGSPEGASSLSLNIGQRFQMARGTLFGGDKERPAEISLRGDWVRINSELQIDGRSAPVTFEGRVKGDIIEGTALYGQGREKKTVPWRAVRQEGTAVALN
ncbi:MAG: amino acid permease [Deltaproteobacteria bacterium]|nr:amino acid permease [Deltaproteobacteria bacterium]